MLKSLALFVVIVIGSCLWAQDYPRLEFSAGYSYGSIDTQGYGTQRNAQGWSGSLTANLKRWVGVETEISSQFHKFDFDSQGYQVAGQTRYYNFLAGPRFAHRTGKGTTFFHGLAGWNRTLDYGNTVLDLTNSTAFTPNTFGMAVVAGGGFDYPISRHLALRTQGDYFFTRQNTISPTANNFRVMTAIVFTFGRSESAYAKRRSETPTVVAAAASPVPTSAIHSEASSMSAEAGPNSDSPREQNQITAPVTAAVAITPEPAMPMLLDSYRSNALTARVEPVLFKPVQPVTSKPAETIAIKSEPVAIKQVETVVIKPVEPTGSKPVESITVKPVTTVAVAHIAPPSQPVVNGSALVSDSHTVILSSQVTAQAQQANTQESLGDIARRYREQKRLREQNQTAAGI